ATSIVQFTVDIAAAVQAHDRAGMNAFTHRFQSLPGAHLTFYTVGPQLFYVGVVVLAITLAVADVTPWWSPILVTAGVSLPVVTLDLIPIGAVLLLIGLLPLMRPVRVSELV
ncbi:MAG TPA: hypothetical protein VHF06_35490, partial [Pseudonocardiaceae bacterium]|nr:hypothetical protein [Pseudonocardiaceae bacterium]